MMVGVIGCLFVTVELVRPAHGHTNDSKSSPEHPAPSRRPAPPAAPLELRDNGDIFVVAGTRVEKKLATSVLAFERVSIPVLTVTGTVVARLSEISPSVERNWHFNDPELMQAYVDLLQDRTEVAFDEKQLAKIKELSAASVKSHKAIVQRLQKLVTGGTDTQKDLASAETELAHAELQGQKEVFEAEAALQKGLTARNSLVRKLAQRGIETDTLDNAPGGTVVVVAEVPESKIGEVQEGNCCSATFYGLPGRSFPGHVGVAAPVLAAEGRTLRVPFEVPDPQRQLRPGMFAEVALGTDERDALFAPADGLLHIGALDYLLVEVAPQTWHPTAVRAGEPLGGRIEILSGVETGKRVMGNGAILLKPLIVQALQKTK
jgi:cobalt-zinc-cadmium efflux system membrane fusion protein